MFTPVNIKKLTNVSVVTLKKYGKRYELAIYPNKLYEYQKGLTQDLNEIVQNQTIFKNVSKGEVCKKEDLDLFCKSQEEIIKEILDRGHEQKNEATRDRETLMAEREIIDLVRAKVTKGGKFLNPEEMKGWILKVHKISQGRIKKQVQEIVSKLEQAGFERVNFKIEVDFERVRGVEGVFLKGDDVFVNSSKFPSFRRHCEENKIPYVVRREEEEEEEEIN